MLARHRVLIALLTVLCSAPLGASVSPSSPGSSADIFRPSRGVHPTRGTAILNIDSGLLFPTIQGAISAATAGDTLEVQVATHGEGQIVVDRDLTLRGATGAEVVQITVDTGSSGDSRAWFLVQAGVDLQVRNLIFDGNGFLVWQAFRHRGTGVFENCTFRDIQFNASGPHYAGTAIAAFGSGGGVDVQNCNFENIGRVGVLLFGTGVSGSVVEDSFFAGKGDGDFLDYGVELGAGATAVLRRNLVTACRGVASVDGSTSAGFLISTFFGPGTEGALESNTALGNTSGFAIGFDNADSSVVTASHNRIVGNSSGINSTSTVTSDGQNNWWGCNGGPGSLGCDATTGGGIVDVDPWLVLELSALPNIVAVGGMASALADLTFNSDATDTSGLGFVPEGVPVDFLAALGSMMPIMAATVSGVAASTFAAGGVAGTALLEATVDNQTVSTSVTILAANPLEVPAPQGWTLGLTALLFFTMAVRQIDRTG